MIQKYHVILVMALFGASCDILPAQENPINSPTPNDIVTENVCQKPKIEYIQVSVEQMNDIYHLNPQEAILNDCLSLNYHQLLGQSTNDGSPFRYSYHTIRGIGEFVQKEAGEFYREALPRYSENGTKTNAIFSRCLAFSRSKKTEDFLRDLKPKECTPKDNKNLIDSDCPEYNY